MTETKKKCLECENLILGRQDKKFCSDLCRNNYNNRVRATDNAVVRNMINLLKKNRRIMEEVCPEEKIKISKKTLDKKGFNFNHFTHLRKTQAGSTYYFIFDYGYLELENDQVLIVKDNRA